MLEMQMWVELSGGIVCFIKMARSHMIFSLEKIV